jgi:acyl-coenzyme A synthetase/AMP-(fatty) acid ligase
LEASAVGVHLPDGPEKDTALEACRLAGKAVLSLEARPTVVVTADASLEDGVVRNFKEETDAAVPDAERVIVFRRVGDAPLAATMDAYLEVPMTPGRDVWADQVGASG